MTASDLKYYVEKAGHESYYFDRKSMKFFGDTMKNYGVRTAHIKTNWNEAGEWSQDGVTVEVWELYRKRPVKHGLMSSSYFDKNTFKRVFEANYDGGVK